MLMICLCAALNISLHVLQSHLLVETQGPQQRVHIVKLSVAEALQPLWVAGLSGQTHSADLETEVKVNRE